MSVTTQNSLFYLIHSLNSTEKGYIKKQASVHVVGDQNKYIKIFEAIDKQKEYDEEAILRMFEGEPILNNFGVAKIYLFKFILKCLEQYHSTVKSELRSTLNHVEILYNKNLPAIAKKMLIKAKATATEYELYEYMEEIIDWEIVFLVEEATPQNYLALVNKYFNELNESIEKKKTIISYKHLYQKLRAKSMFYGIARNDEDVLEYKKIFDQSKANDQSLLNTFNANFYRNLMHSNFLFTLNEQSEANYFLNQNVDLFHGNMHMVDVKPFAYIGILRNKAVNELSLMRYKDLFATIEKMDEFIKKQGHLNRYYEILTENLKLFVYIPMGEFKKALTVAQNLENVYKLIPPNKLLLKEKLLQHYAYAYIYIGLEDYKNANHHINLLLAAPENDFRSDVYCFAHILSLIIHFELQNKELLVYRIRSTYRLLDRRNKLHEFEKHIFSFLRNSLDRKGKKADITKGFLKLKNNIEKSTKNKVEQNALSLFDLISWLESKIENKSFMEIKQAKFKNQQSSEAHNAHLH
jgi:hypothetical protein